MSLLQAPTSSQRFSPVLAVAVAMLAIILHVGVLNSPLIGDSLVVTAGNRQVVGPEGWPLTWTQAMPVHVSPVQPWDGPVGAWRPLTAALLRLQWGAWGASPSSFRAVNLLLLVGMLLAMLWLSAELIHRSWLRALAVALVAAHPFTAHNVLQVGGQGVLIAVAAMLLGSAWAARLVRGPTGPHTRMVGVIGLGLCQLAAILAHELGFLMPAWILLTALLASPGRSAVMAPTEASTTPGTSPAPRERTGRSRRRRRRNGRESAVERAPERLEGFGAESPTQRRPLIAPLVAVLLGVMLVAGLARAIVLGSPWPDAAEAWLGEGYSTAWRLAHGPAFALAYLVRVLWPAEPSIMLSFAYEPDLLPGAVWGWLVLALLVALIAVVWRRVRTVAVGLVLLTVSLLALAQGIPLGEFMAEAAAAPVVVALALVLGAALDLALGHAAFGSRQSWRPALLIGLLALLAVGSAQQTWRWGRRWRAPETFWSTEAGVHPAHPDPHLRLADLALARKRPDEGLEHVAQARERLAPHIAGGDADDAPHPDVADSLDRLHNLAARLHALEDDRAAMRDVFDEVLADGRERREGYLALLGNLAARHGLFTQSEKLWLRDLADHPDSFYALAALARQRYEAGLAAEALEPADRAVRHAPPELRAAALTLLGEVLIAAGRPDEAQKPLSIAIDLAPRDVDAYARLAEAALATGETELAERAVDWALSRTEPATIAELARLGVVAREAAGDDERALALLRRLLEHHPMDWPLHVYAARHYLDIEDYDEARRLFERTIAALESAPEVQPAALAQALVGRGILAMRLEDDAATARRAWRRATQIDPDNVDAPKLLERLREVGAP